MHNREGLLTIPSDSPDERRFIITMAEAPQLDRQSRVIGRVLQGIEVLRSAWLAEWTDAIDGTDYYKRIIIADCGLLSE